MVCLPANPRLSNKKEQCGTRAAFLPEAVCVCLGVCVSMCLCVCACAWGGRGWSSLPYHPIHQEKPFCMTH